MTASHSIFKTLLAAALLACATTAAAVLQVDPFSRWTQVPMANADRLYTGGPGGATVVLLRRDAGPLRSFDGGVTWAPFNTPSQTFWIYAAPTAARTWYAYFDGALYRTTDGGDSWEKRSEALPAHTGAQYLSVSADPDVLYQSTYVMAQCDFECPATSQTLQVSLDGGRHWQDVRAPEGFAHGFASPVDSRVVFYLGSGGFLRSADRGATWLPVNVPYPGPPANIATGAVTFDALDGSVVYLRTGIGMNAALPPIFSTRDGGETWTASSLPPASHLYADPAQRGRAYLFAYFDGAFETRDAGLTWVHVEPFFNQGLNEDVDAVVTRGRKRFGLNAEFLMLKELDLNDGALALRSDLWWNAGEPGMGLTITHRGSNQTFVAWYAYGADGAPVWRVVPGGQWNDRTFIGDMYETTGAPVFGTAFDPSKVVSRKVGSVQLQFDNEDSALFSYQLGTGAVVDKRIVREMFGAPVQVPAVDDNYADLWWNAAEPGWGIAISHQDDNIFATWFVYDAQGKPLWIVMPNARFTAGSQVPKVTGDIYTTHGPSSNGPYDASQVVATKVGTASITFNSRDAALLEFTVSGAAGSRAITRQPF